MTDEIIVRDANAFMPLLEIGQAVHRFKVLNTFIQEVMREKVDYGSIPGTNDKLVLLKPGAEKLTTLFGLSTRFEITKEIEDWTGQEHGGEPLFYYRIRCSLWRGDLLVAEADGSCNSREAKYRWRYADRVCPECSQPTIIKGREEYGGGWLCWKKKGGCGAKFSDGEPTIEEQPQGRIPNEDIASQVNTILKMSEKRALVAAVLIAVNASEYFTQDLEDLDIIDVTPIAPREATEPANGNSAPPRTYGQDPRNWNHEPPEALEKRFHALGRELYGPDWDTKRPALVKGVTRGETHSSGELTAREMQHLIDGMNKKLTQADVPF